MPGRPSSSQRTRRRLALIPLLSAEGRVPLSRLAVIVGSDTATVTADIEALSVCGVDDWNLVAVGVEGDAAIVFGPPPALERPVRLTGAEARALLAALDVVGAGAEGGLASRLEAIASSVKDVEHLARAVRAASAPGSMAHTIAVLTACAGGHRVARITHTSQGAADATARTVQPLRLFLWRGEWYLLAWSEDDGEERTFRLDRISAAEATGRAFEPPAGDAASSATGAAPDPDGLPRAEIIFAHDRPDLTEREWPGATFDRRDDASVVASVPYAGTRWVARKVAAFLGDAVVTSPEEVRSAVGRLSRDELAGV